MLHPVPGSETPCPRDSQGPWCNTVSSAPPGPAPSGKSTCSVHWGLEEEGALSPGAILEEGAIGARACTPHPRAEGRSPASPALRGFLPQVPTDSNFNRDYCPISTAFHVFQLFPAL